MPSLQLCDYGLIGNSTSASLVSRLGSIDWCCFPYLDSPSHFGAILDENLGGKFQIMPQGDFRSEQRYLQRTFILETHFETPHGRATLTDWMPLEHDVGSAGEERVIRRHIEVQSGRIAWTLLCSPRFDYGTQIPLAESANQGVLFRSPISGDQTTGLLQSNIPLEISTHGSAAIAKFQLHSGQMADFSWSWGRRRPPLTTSWRETAEQWRRRAHHCNSTHDPLPHLTRTTSCILSGPWHDTVVRSALTLRLLFYSHLGSLAESITTSVSGIPNSSRTWDYRYSWIRTLPLALHCWLSLNHVEEAQASFRWLSSILLRDAPASLQSAYRLDGGKELQEKEMTSWQGYLHSKPVRVGNSSPALFQLDIYGQILLAVAEYFYAFGKLPEATWEKIIEIADYICQAWRRPDHGIWEIRSKPEHYVTSKVYCWVALDRACTLMQATQRPTPARWEEEKNILHRTICEQGYDVQRRSFIRSFGDRDLDASALLIPLVGFLPFEDPRIQNTLLAIQEELSKGVLLYRYKTPDGLPGFEGFHLASSFHLVSCLARSGQVDQASDHLAELCSYATSLGLFGEQIDPAQGETSGNIPCASVYTALIQAAISVGAARNRLTSAYGLIGQPLPAARTA